jgi:hypothetical protein
MKKCLLFFVAFALLNACSEKSGTGKVNIRLSNVSDSDFKDIVVNTSTGDVSYGSLASQEVSDYKPFELAYRYAFIELTANDTIYTLQPIDYVGETPLENGHYTYILDLEGQGQYNSLIVTLIED